MSQCTSPNHPEFLSITGGAHIHTHICFWKQATRVAVPCFKCFLLDHVFCAHQGKESAQRSSKALKPI